MTSSTSKEGTQFKIFSYNTLIEKNTYTPTVKNDRNWRAYNWKQRLEQIILKIVSENADVVCLQEIRHVSRHMSPNFYDFYDSLSEMGFEGIFGKRNLSGEFGEEGLAIFYNKLNLSLIKTDTLNFEDETGRLALSATFRSFSGNIFRVVTTHIMFPHPIEKTISQIEFLSKWHLLHEESIPCILTGDFNLSSSISAHKNILNFLTERFIDSHEYLECNLPTFSLNLQGNNSPGMIRQPMGTRIDYIFVSKDIKISEVGVSGKIESIFGCDEPSDHLPVTGTFVLPVNKVFSILEDLEKMKELFEQCQERNEKDTNYNSFLRILWDLPEQIKNTMYYLTYCKATKLGLYEENPEFGRAAFTNNIKHGEIRLDENGNKIKIDYANVKEDIIPSFVIQEILDITIERIVVIPKLLVMIENFSFAEFLEEMDKHLHAENCNEIYKEVYKIAFKKGYQIYHFDFGRASFRKLDGLDLPNSIRVEALRKLVLN